MRVEQIQNLFSFLKRFGWVILTAIAVVIGAVVFAENKGMSSPNSPGVLSDVKKDIGKAFQKYPACPAELSGILTAPLMDPAYISAIIPLGNLNPPGHTSPVDHNYFSTAYDGKIPLYAPATSTITSIIEISRKDASGTYVPDGYVIQYTVCDGLILDFAGYTGLSETITKELESKKANSCKYGIDKPGHDFTQGQCYFNVSVPVGAGQEIGYTQKDARGGLPFEIWAANYNKPSRADVNWKFYNDDRYAHSMCTFDLYSGELKNRFYGKFGFVDNKINKGLGGQIYSRGEDIFVPRIVEPLCGTVNQDLPGTLQGMWYGEKDPGGGNLEFQGKGLAFIHYNLDPTMGALSIGGNFMSAGVILFEPTHSGAVNREFSEVKADGKVYCYDNPESGWQEDTGKVLVQLLENHSLNIEHQAGACTGEETLEKPLTYYR